MPGNAVFFNLYFDNYSLLNILTKYDFERKKDENLKNYTQTDNQKSSHELSLR